MKKIAIVISVEHAVNTIPEAYQDLFAAHRILLNTHRGIDFGSLTIAEHLAKTLCCDLVVATTSRLLIDNNRSLHHPACFSEITQSLSKPQKQTIIDNYYLPYRQQIETIIQHKIDQNMRVWHFSIHSFTPVLNNITRNTDIGLLYDSKRCFEKQLAIRLKNIIKEQTPSFRVRMNYPYQGKSDSFTAALRKKHAEIDYLGIELESNQALVFDERRFDELIKVLDISFVLLRYT